MKIQYPLFVLLILFCSCSKTIMVNDIIKRNEIRANYQYKYDNHKGFYICKTKSYSLYKRTLIDSFTKDFTSLDKKDWKGTLTPEEKKRYNEAKSKLENPKFLEFDSSKNLIVSFDGQIQNLNYSTFAIHYWDYSNFRFIIPFLMLGNRIHLINKCVNKAIVIAEKNGADGVIINSDLYSSRHFKIIK